MKVCYKFAFLFIILCGYICFSGILYLELPLFQLMCLSVTLIACSLRFGIKKLTNEIRLILPFIIMMLAVYFIIGLLGFHVQIGLHAGQSVLQYWLLYGTIRSMLFISTMLALQLLLSFLSIRDIMSLPIRIHKKRYMLLGKTLFVHSIKYIDEIELHLNQIPEYQKQRLSIRQWFRFKFQLSLAIIIMILRESQIKGELIDNRINHCFHQNRE